MCAASVAKSRAEVCPRNDPGMRLELAHQRVFEFGVPAKHPGAHAAELCMC